MKIILSSIAIAAVVALMAGSAFAQATNPAPQSPVTPRQPTGYQVKGCTWFRTTSSSTTATYCDTENAKALALRDIRYPYTGGTADGGSGQ